MRSPKKVSLEVDQAVEMGPIDLEEKGRYVLDVAMRGKPRAGFLADLELSVQRGAMKNLFLNLKMATGLNPAFGVKVVSPGLGMKKTVKRNFILRPLKRAPISSL